jgi:hypothetical protein
MDTNKNTNCEAINIAILICRLKETETSEAMQPRRESSIRLYFKKHFSEERLALLSYIRNNLMKPYDDIFGNHRLRTQWYCIYIHEKEIEEKNYPWV